MVPENPVLITGASGFVATELVRHFVGGYLVSRSAGARPVVANWRWLSRSDVLATLGIEPTPNMVIHLEVKQNVFHSTRRDIEAFRRVNVDGTREWLNWCTQDVGRRFL